MRQEKKGWRTFTLPPINMIAEKVLTRSLWYSCIAHIVFFSVFNFSFGLRIAKPCYPGISFLGKLVRAADVCAPFSRSVSSHRPALVATDGWLLPQSQGVAISSRDYCLKPQNKATLQATKEVKAGVGIASVPLPKRKESVVMFHPQLPYHFLLYFMDRQEAHLELAFLITSYEETHSVTIKRKISSGNLEVDLLSMRYLDHYLSMQLGRFPLNQWQSVKIDFRPKNE